MPTFQSRFKETQRRVPIDEHNCSVQFDESKKIVHYAATRVQTLRLLWIIIIWKAQATCLSVSTVDNVRQYAPLGLSLMSDLDKVC